MRLVWSGDSSLFHRAGEDESWSFFARPAGALFIGGGGGGGGGGGLVLLL